MSPYREWIQKQNDFLKRGCINPKTILYGRDAILRVRAKLLIFNMVLKLWADVKYHVPTGFGFSPKASGFCFSPPVFIHRTEGRSWYRPILHNHNRPSPRLNPTPYPNHQATLNRSAIFACMVFRIMRHLRCQWLQISFLVGFYIYFAQIGAFSRKIIIFAKARLSITLKY